MGDRNKDKVCWGAMHHPVRAAMETDNCTTRLVNQEQQYKLDRRADCWEMVYGTPANIYQEKMCGSYTVCCSMSPQLACLFFVMTSTFCNVCKAFANLDMMSIEVFMLDWKIGLTWRLCVCSVHKNGIVVYGTPSGVALADRISIDWRIGFGCHGTYLYQSRSANGLGSHCSCTLCTFL